MDRPSAKLYYKIGEACKALDIQPYVLRYWETEFPVLSPSKSKSGQRVYTDRELEVIRRIKELLYDEGYTIAGAKKKLESELAAPGGFGSASENAQQDEEPVETAILTLPLDTARQPRVETARRRIRVAIAEARAILALLDGTSSQS